MMALKACADAGRWEHALAILEGMKGIPVLLMPVICAFGLSRSTGIHRMTHARWQF